MQLDTIESGHPRASRGLGKDSRQGLWQFANVRQMRIGNAFAIAEAQRFEFAFAEHAIDDRVGRVCEKRADLCIAFADPIRISGDLGNHPALIFGDLKKALEIFCWIGPALDRQEVDDLNYESGVTLARVAHRVDQLTQSGQEPIVTDSQEGTAGNIANTGGFDDQRGRLAFGEPPVPIQIGLSDETIFSGAPRDHCGHPRASSQLERADFDWLK